MIMFTTRIQVDSFFCLKCSNFINLGCHHPTCSFISTFEFDSTPRLYQSSKDITSSKNVIVDFPHVFPLDLDTNKIVKGTRVPPKYTFSSCQPETVSHFTLTSTNHNNNSLTTTSQSAVVNLSSFHLTEPMLSLLSKGLNFCPTPGEPDAYELRKDLDKFHVNLRRKQFFSKKDDLDDSIISTLDTSISYTSLYRADGPFNHQKFSNPSKWNPIGPVNLEAMIISNEHDLNGYIPYSPGNHNLTLQEREALELLKNNNNIVIKRADKGSAVVIQDRIDYINEGLRQLSDNNFYREVPTDLTQQHNTEVSKLIDNLLSENEISDKCADYLCNAQPRTPQLYLLPKIHKNKTPVPGRPIVSANNSPTEKISQLADHFLKPIVQTTKSYVKDTTDFINKVEQIPHLPDGTILATIDVTSLYTNIPHDEGIQACERFLNLHRANSEQPSNTNIIQLLDCVLKMNNFDFNGKHYLQVGGTAMGTKVAPSLANLFMAYFEDKFVYTYPFQPTIWLRYIDDIFLIWEHGNEKFEVFLNHLNTCHQTIKFTSEVSLASVNFLDTTVSLDHTRKLYTTLYCKPTDSHNYLSFESAHPIHTKRGLPYSQLLRVRRICHHIEDYDTNAVLIGSHFIRRGYPQKLIEKNIIEIRRLNRQSLLQPSTKTTTDLDDQRHFVINTFTPGQNALKDIVNNNWSLLGRTNTTSSIHSTKIIFGYRRNTNLKDSLVHAKLRPETPLKQPKNNSKSCTNFKCEYCPRLDHTGRITSSYTGRTYNTRHAVSCKSNNIIYCITCLCCNKQYVGQTKKCLHERFYYHFKSIRGIKGKPRPRPKNQTLWKPTSKKYDNPIERHFKLPNHIGLNSIRIHVLQFISAPSYSIPAQTLRNEWELLWIHRLKTLSPLGLNTAD